jgi:hypothetical protein
MDPMSPESSVYENGSQQSQTQECVPGCLGLSESGNAILGAERTAPSTVYVVGGGGETGGKECWARH